MALTNSLEDLDTAYTNYFEKRAEKPKFKVKGIHNTYKTDCIRSKYKENEYANIILDLDNKKIKLPKVGIVDIRGYRHFN